MCYTIDWPLSTVSSLSIPYHTSGGGFAGGGRGLQKPENGGTKARDLLLQRYFFMAIMVQKMLRTPADSKFPARNTFQIGVLQL